MTGRTDTLERRDRLGGRLRPVAAHCPPQSCRGQDVGRPEREGAGRPLSAMVTGELTGRRRADQETRATRVAQRGQQLLVLESGGGKDDDDIGRVCRERGCNLSTEVGPRLVAASLVCVGCERLSHATEYATGTTRRQACAGGCPARYVRWADGAVRCLVGQTVRGRERLAPQVGFEPTTLRLTAGCSAIELLRNLGRPRGGHVARAHCSCVRLRRNEPKVYPAAPAAVNGARRRRLHPSGWPLRVRRHVRPTCTRARP